MSVGLVIVSHSSRIAEGVVELAGQMAQGVTMRAAGGTDDGRIGTSFERIEAAVAELSGEGCVLLCDLGSAIMTAETVLETLDDEARSRVRLADAPLVEGAVAAGVAAATGGSLDEVERAATGAWGREAAAAGAGEHASSLDAAGAAPADESASPITEGAPMSADRRSLVLQNAEGLHARPAAQFVKTASAFDAKITANGVDAKSLLRIMGLGLKQGATLELEAEGAQAAEALDALTALVESGFGE